MPSLTIPYGSIVELAQRGGHRVDRPLDYFLVRYRGDNYRIMRRDLVETRELKD